MFSLSPQPKTPEAPVEQTFKWRVEQFWAWYSAVAERFYQTIEDGKCASLGEEVSDKVDEFFAPFAWVFGAGKGEGHSFTLSGEGNQHRQLLAAYWLSQAPSLPGWTFYSARQPSAKPGEGHIRIDGKDFDPKAFWLTPVVDDEHEEIDLTVWHPMFPELDDRARWTILFLFLDEALGEIGTQNWIGRIEMNDSQLAGAIPLAELHSFTERVQAEKGWKKGVPGELWTSYELEGDHPGEPRGDVFVGSTGLFVLIQKFHAAKGQFADPLAETGADYVYVAFDATILPKGGEVDGRARIEDALGEALEKTNGGRVLGGAMGRENAYVDLLLYDGMASLATVRRVLEEMQLPEGTSINYFAHEKRGHRLVL